MRQWLTFRRKVILIVVGLLIGAASILFTSRIGNRLRERERDEVRLLTLFLANEAMFRHENNPAVELLERSYGNVPFLVVDQNARVRHSHMIAPEVLANPDRLREIIVRLGDRNQALEITSPYERLWVYYGTSRMRQLLIYFPVAQILVLIIFAAFGYITFRSSRDDEQNRVWIGLAKETAHQLGTPTSSLLGWLEYLRGQPIDQSAVDEIGNDLSRLTKVIDRFSKIGSETVLSPAVVNEVVGGSVDYFRSRIPRNVTLDYNGYATAPVGAMLNEALFEWVVENLLKNALDALQGTGSIGVVIWCDDMNANIDVTDTGKGIAKTNWRRIFEPGYTTKTRGWGLGLSLSKRIIEDYHRGRIFVVDSEPGLGTTIRISLKLMA